MLFVCFVLSTGKKSIPVYDLEVYIKIKIYLHILFIFFLYVSLNVLLICIAGSLKQANFILLLKIMYFGFILIFLKTN